jgi:prepilin-type N-terminal cleavage/methylation domain-containing protein
MRRIFTLVELLVVITILAVLLSLFQPAMRKAIYRASMVKCQTNLKNVGFGLFLYCDDNNDFFPKGRYNSGGSAGQVAETRASFNETTKLGFRNDILNGMQAYFNGGSNENMSQQGLYGSAKKSFENSFLCPQVDNEEVWPFTAGWGNYHYRRVPRYYASDMPYQLYWGVRAHGGTAVVMEKLEDTWNWGTGYQLSGWDYGPREAASYNYSILAADVLVEFWGSSWTEPISNHKMPGNIGSSATRNGYRGYQIENSFEVDSNYLFTDGSVKYYEIPINPTREGDFYKFYNATYVPVEAGSEK